MRTLGTDAESREPNENDPDSILDFIQSAINEEQLAYAQLLVSKYRFRNENNFWPNKFSTALTEKYFKIRNEIIPSIYDAQNLEELRHVVEDYYKRPLREFITHSGLILYTPNTITFIVDRISDKFFKLFLNELFEALGPQQVEDVYALDEEEFFEIIIDILVKNDCTEVFTKINGETDEAFMEHMRNFFLTVITTQFLEEIISDPKISSNITMQINETPCIYKLILKDNEDDKKLKDEIDPESLATVIIYSCMPEPSQEVDSDEQFDSSSIDLLVSYNPHVLERLKELAAEIQAKRKEYLQTIIFNYPSQLKDLDDRTLKKVITDTTRTDIPELTRLEAKEYEEFIRESAIRELSQRRQMEKEI